MPSEKLKLYVWQQRDGGWSRAWRLPPSVPSTSPWFLFGRFCGGYAPFSNAKMGTREETQLAAERAFERFGLPVDVFYGQAPPNEDYESNPPTPPGVVRDIHAALAALNPSTIEEWAGGVWGFKLPGDAVSGAHTALKSLGGWRTLAKHPSGVNMRKGKSEAQVSKSPYSAYTQVVVDTKPD